MINKWCVTRVNYKIRANVEILRELLYDEIYVGNESGSRKQSCLDLSIFNFDQAIKGKRKRKIHWLTFHLFHEQIVVQSSCWTRFVPSTKIWRGRTKRGFPRTWTGRDGNRASPRLAVESLTGEISTAISAIDIPRVLRYPSCLSWRTANFQQEKEYLIS